MMMLTTKAMICHRKLEDIDADDGAVAASAFATVTEGLLKMLMMLLLACMFTLAHCCASKRAVELFIFLAVYLFVIYFGAIFLILIKEFFEKILQSICFLWKF